MKTVLTYGTFDLFHIGHLRLLQRASKLGDRLIVGVSSDQFNELKGKQSVLSYANRAAIVRAIKYVDKVIPEHDWDQKVKDIKKYNVDVFAIGDDWKGKFDTLKDHCDVQYLARTKGISTTQLKQALHPFRSEKLDELQEGITALQTILKQLDL